MSLNKEILQALRKLKNDVKSGDYNFDQGICLQVEQNICENKFGSYDWWDLPRSKLDQIEKKLQSAFTKWPRYSGNKTYPVSCKHKNFIVSEDEAMYVFDRTYDMWSKTTQYGRNRRNLLNFLIKHFESKV
jgi:hypothetical protein